MADEKISQLSDGGAPLDTDQLVIARSGSSLSLLFSAIKAAIPGGVASVFGRTGAVVATNGDYTAAQVGALPSTETLDQIATANATAASVAMNSHKLTGLAAGTGAGDSVRFEQIPTALPPNGTAGGDLSGTYPNPAVKAVTETSGPTDLTIGTITDGQFLKRSGSTLVSAAAGSGTVTSVTSADTSIAVATTTTTPVMTVAALNTIAANHATSGDVAMNSHKITGLTNGSASTDAAAFGQLPLTAGLTSLVYRYTVTGSDKASIDTGVDTADAGSNDWTNGDLLEIYLNCRTDEASVRSLVICRLNNDSGANYDIHSFYAINATVSSDGPTLGGTSWSNNVNGASCAANYFSGHRFSIIDYAGTVTYKRGGYELSLGDSTAANVVSGLFGIGYKSTSAVTRFSMTPNTSGKKFKVGTQLLIYKRLAS